MLNDTQERVIKVWRERVAGSSIIVHADTSQRAISTHTNHGTPEEVEQTAEDMERRALAQLERAAVLRKVAHALRGRA